jgi:hypothetical protein
MSLEKEYQRTSRLTQRKAGRSDNNEGGETPYSDASMAWRAGSIFEHWPGRYAGKIPFHNRVRCSAARPRGNIKTR